MYHSESPVAATIHITSLLVQVAPHGREAAKLAVSGVAGARLHSTACASKWVVMLESAEDAAAAAMADLLLQIPGVLTVSIISHLMEYADALEQEIG